MAESKSIRCEIAIIGGGIVGSAIAMALSERGIGATVIDVDLSGRLSSSERNAGGVRATWWNPVNIALCRKSIAYYETIGEEIGLRQKGYLVLYDQKRWAEAESKLGLQRAFGQEIEKLTAHEVSARVPEIDRLDGIAAATFSPRDGLLNPNLLKEHYRRRSRAGEERAQYFDRTCVYGVEAGASEVRLFCWQDDDKFSDDELRRMMSHDEAGQAEAGQTFEVAAQQIVIAAGAWAANILQMAGLRNYTSPVRRQISIVDNRETSLEGYGMIFDTSGLYCHNEGAHILAGYSPPDEPAGYSFRYDGEAFFEREIWPRMYLRMSCMERLRHVTGWAGLYAVTPDRSAIVGRATKRVYDCHSFTGHGVMQSYGAGQAIADLIVRGCYGAFDASGLERGRFEAGRLVYEELHY
jgi:sarcosine oxidase subunit beta